MGTRFYVFSAVNPSIPVQVSVPASENLSKTNLKGEVSEIEIQSDEEFDEWQDFTCSKAAKNMSDSVESREPVKAEGDNFFKKERLLYNMKYTSIQSGQKYRSSI